VALLESRPANHVGNFQYFEKAPPDMIGLEIDSNSYVRLPSPATLGGIT
jgi:hypothetical protein